MKYDHLIVAAGKSAYSHIRKNGLHPDDIHVVLGASGAAKWLVLYGLDHAVFSNWFSNRKNPLHLFGTSIGAWKFAAAARKNPAQGLTELKDLYIHQYFGDRITDAIISKETQRIMTRFLSTHAIDDILQHPVFKIGFSAVRCKGIMASKTRFFQAAAMWSSFELNLLSRQLQKYYFDRVIFHHPDFNTQLFDFTDFHTLTVGLTRNNFSQAILASASIPLIMKGVTGIEGAPKGTYRDGGLLDYHPVFPLADNTDKLILYPHFYPYIKPGWFDKKLPGRATKGELLDRVILICPSPLFVECLPHGRIPDRNDFIRFKGRDTDRILAWNQAADMSRKLGDIFLDLTSRGRLADHMTRLN